jgi:hypothetical protein
MNNEEIRGKVAEFPSEIGAWPTGNVKILSERAICQKFSTGGCLHAVPNA